MSKFISVDHDRINVTFSIPTFRGYWMVIANMAPIVFATGCLAYTAVTGAAPIISVPTALTILAMALLNIFAHMMTSTSNRCEPLLLDDPLDVHDPEDRRSEIIKRVDNLFLLDDQLYVHDDEYGDEPVTQQTMETEARGPEDRRSEIIKLVDHLYELDKADPGFGPAGLIDNLLPSEHDNQVNNIHKSDSLAHCMTTSRCNHYAEHAMRTALENDLPH